ncbi:RhuM family protein [Parabacteroides chongii]|uniref:RhuM family protein n=1 Tax=Parabacteroides chongii TaxID=2685834 RepID=UPI00240E26E5|nr:RhuM family protein [Parabacteroides chongii]WFE86240.1 RhuM family protein [Parabacteroides chongii]
MGLTNTSQPDKVHKADISISKNYLSEDEINMLKLIVEQFLAYAEAQAMAHKPMYMRDWIEKLKLVLTLNEKSILEDAGCISHQLAVQKAGQEYDKYKQIQRSLERLNSIKELDEDIKRLKGKNTGKPGTNF